MGVQMNLTAPDYVVLIVEDLDRALKFYADILGLRLGHRSGEYAQLDTGSTRLALYTREAMSKTLGIALQRPDVDAAAFEIGFKVKDVDTAFAELVQRGAAPVTSPINRPWGQRTGYVRDPDGHLVELAQDLRKS
jgi:lactoylglutathione lyase